MVAGKPVPYFTRMEIEKGALAEQGLEIAYLRDWADAYFIHLQGSGRVRLEDGTAMRLTFDAKSGRPYTGIGSLLVARGVLTADEVSMQSIRYWMAAHPHEARSLMWENQSFIFLREIQLEDPRLGALGAQHVQLTPRRSLAIDRSQWMLGTPIWIDIEVPSGEEGTLPFRQLLIAQDTGSAIVPREQFPSH
jgi:membrane-bound lytic murein transglycosylase A